MNYKQLSEIINQQLTHASDNLPQNAFDIALQLNIRIKNHIECKCDFNENDYPLKNTDAILAMHGNEYTIYYDENNPYSNFAIAHEIAHYLLKHTSDGAEQHRDAQLMAAILVVPPHLISLKNIKSADVLSNTYKIPIDAAKAYWDELYSSSKEVRSTCLTKPIIAIVIVISVLTLLIYFINKSQTKNSDIYTEAITSLQQNIPIVTVTPTTQSTENIISPSPVTNQVDINTVYITRTGKKYHKFNCSHIQKSTPIEISIEAAINSGYEPCKDCMQ